MVDLYVARHEEAEPGHSKPDRHRCLTGYGRRRGRATGQLLMARPETIDTIWTSPLVRAVQTAEIYASALGIDEAVATFEIIASPPNISGLIDLATDCPANTQGLMIVGHQPTLGVFISELLQHEYPRSLRPGAVVALELDRRRRVARFRWAIEGSTPAIVDDLEA